MSRRIGFLFPVGDMQGYINLKGYGKFEASNRPSGWNIRLTFAICPMAPTSTVTPTRRFVTNQEVPSRGWIDITH